MVPGVLLTCGSARRLEARPGPIGQAVRFFETPVAFARSYVPGVETVITFAGRRGAPVETAIAFAAMKRAILVRFLVAVVTVVSTVAIQGRAVVMGVSC